MKKRGKPRYNVGAKADRTYNGVVYMSKLEMEYRMYLDRQKDVVSIEEQVPFVIEINGKKIFKYLLDFKVTYKDGRVEYVDPKGPITPIYRIKKKAVEAMYGITIKEVYKGDF